MHSVVCTHLDSMNYCHTQVMFGSAVRGSEHPSCTFWSKGSSSCEQWRNLGTFSVTGRIIWLTSQVILTSCNLTVKTSHHRSTDSVRLQTHSTDQDPCGEGTWQAPSGWYGSSWFGSLYIPTYNASKPHSLGNLAQHHWVHSSECCPLKWMIVFCTLVCFHRNHHFGKRQFSICPVCRQDVANITNFDKCLESANITLVISSY